MFSRNMTVSSSSGRLTANGTRCTSERDGAQEICSGSEGAQRRHRCV